VRWLRIAEHGDTRQGQPRRESTVAFVIVYRAEERFDDDSERNRPLFRD
jgi:hypothetical protein